LWDENNYCSAEALFKDGKDKQFNVVELHETTLPQIDSLTHTVMRDGGEFVDNRWQYRWSVNQKTSEQVAIEQAERLTQLQFAARAQRNQLLTTSDWTQVIDAPVNQEAWATYRQSLRNVPQQDGFPTTIVWPVKPE
jgi:hypothetical protein